MKNAGLILLMLFTFLVTSCKKEIDQPPVQNPEKMSDLKVAGDFNWKTFSNVTIDLTAPSDGLVSVVSSSGKVLQKAYLTQGKTYPMKLTIASNTQMVHLLYMGQDVSINLDSEHIAWSFK